MDEIQKFSTISDDESSAESEVEIHPGTNRSIVPVNNVEALQAKLKSVQINLEWVERLDTCVNVEEIENSQDDDPDAKPENDFKREMTFYNQAMSAVTKAIKRLKKLNIPTKRPSDYFAEMAKSDEHMNKVREKLLSKQTAIERREQVRAIREQKKMGKKIQHEIVQEKKSQKKKMINALKKSKKGKMDAETLLNDKPGDSNKPSKGSKFREFRDNKYGYGGKKRGSKWNTADSSAGNFSQNNSNRSSKDKKFGKNKPRPKKHRRRR